MEINPVSERIVAVLFDIDGTLIITGGAGAESWRLAFDELYGIPADIAEFTDTGLTDPDVGRQTFKAVLDREPETDEFARLMECRTHHLHKTVAESKDYRVLDGVEDLLPQLLEAGLLLGLVTGNVEAAAHVKLHRANLNRYFACGGYGSDSTDRGEVARTALRQASLVYGEELAPSRCIVVGDTPHDADGAHAGGMICVGVASHKFSAAELEKGGAEYVISSLAHGLPEAALGRGPIRDLRP